MKHIIMLEDSSSDQDPCILFTNPYFTDEMVEALAVPLVRASGGVSVRQHNRIAMLASYFEGEDDEQICD